MDSPIDRMTTRDQARGDLSVASILQHTVEHPSPQRIVSLETIPLESIEGVVIADVLELMNSSSSPPSGANYDPEQFRDDYVLGILRRTPKLEENPALLLAFREWIEHRIRIPESARTVFGVRGVIGISDPNSGDLVDPEGVPIVGATYSRITRHDYSDFATPIQFVRTAGADYFAAAEPVTGYEHEADDRLSSLDTYIDLLLPGREGTSREANARFRTIASGIGSDLARGRIPNAALGQGGADPPLFDNDFLLATVHPVIGVDGIVGDKLVLADGGIPGFGDEDERSLMAFELVVQDQPEDGPTHRGFGEIRADDLKDGALVSLSGIAVSQMDVLSGQVLRFAKLAFAEPKPIETLDYQKQSSAVGTAEGASTVETARTVMSVIEADQEDVICIVARYLVPGPQIEESDNDITKPRKGYAELAVFPFRSSITPPMPTLRSVIPLEWNLRFEWETLRRVSISGNPVDPGAAGTVRRPIYDATNEFDVDLEWRRARPDNTFSPLSTSRSLAVVLSESLLGGTWQISDPERAMLQSWLRGEPINTRRIAAESGRYTARLPANVVSDGSVLLAPKPEDPSEPHLGLPGIGLTRRDTWEWRCRIQAIENPNIPGFELRSNWTDWTDWFTPRPIMPRWQPMNPHQPISQPGNYPSSEFHILYNARNKTMADVGAEGGTSYQLIIRRAVAEQVEGAQPNNAPTRLVTVAVVPGAVVPERSNSYPVLEFYYTDQEVVARGDAPRGFGYDYEFEVHLIEGERVVSKGESTLIVNSENQFSNLPPEYRFEIVGFERDFGSVLPRQQPIAIAASSYQLSAELVAQGWKQTTGNSYDGDLAIEPRLYIPLKILKQAPIHGGSRLFLDGDPGFTSAILLGAEVDDGGFVVPIQPGGHVSLFLT